MVDVTLTLGSTIWHGWQEVSVSRSIEALAGAFSLTLADRWEADGTVLGIAPDMACTVQLGGETVITGFVDTVEPSFDHQSHSIAVTGRDASADLVDCSAVHEPGEWLEIGLGAVARRLAEPFGVPVHASILSPERFPKFAIQPGETAFAALERACRMRGVLAWPDAEGGIVLAEPGLKRCADGLMEGENVKAARASFTRKGRFSHYIVKGQAQGSDDLNGADASQVRGAATDQALSRYRPLLIVAESGSSQLSARGRARWQATVNAGRSARVVVTVAGWRQSDGSLWPVGSLVRTSLPTLHVERDMLVAGVEYSLGASGSVTRLTLMRPDAFAPQAAFREPAPVIRTSQDPTPVPESVSYAEEWGR